MKHDFGLVCSIVGLWLTGAGLLGAQRLQRWEMIIRRWTRHPLDFPRRFYRRITDFIETSSVSIAVSGYVGKVFQKVIAVLVPAYKGMLALAVVFFVIALIDLNSWPVRVLLFFALGFVYVVLFLMAFLWIFGMLVVVLGLVLPFATVLLAHLSAVLIWLGLQPYRLLDVIVIKIRLESTLTLLGFVLGTVGLLLLV